MNDEEYKQIMARIDQRLMDAMRPVPLFPPLWQMVVVVLVAAAVFAAGVVAGYYLMK